MIYVAGIDGGQTSTVAVIGDENGRIVGRGRSGGADEVGAHEYSTRMRDALLGAYGDAAATADLREEDRVAAVVAGVSGYEGRVFGEPPVFETPRFVLMHDAPVAHAGALAGKPGVCVVAGTGSVVYATDGTHGRTTGGWGPFFGDEGSGFWLACQALAELMRASDDGDESISRDVRAACDFFATTGLRHLARGFYAGELDRGRVASFAPIVLKLARFRPLVERGAARLAELAAAAVARGAAPVVACTGGMFENVPYRKLVHAEIAKRAPGVAIVEPKYEPAVGALLLAYREAGIPVAL
ncbi:MAG TPA: BadF/BadG/BcrA/BcrD ATPase family protein [Verrucomicrobiae bacterium]|nr:BadF/BadG/BcrA/BcrD ATPase family protein [Verrucomicrobiae bacterium]